MTPSEKKNFYRNNKSQYAFNEMMRLIVGYNPLTGEFKLIDTGCRLISATNPKEIRVYPDAYDVSIGAMSKARLAVMLMLDVRWTTFSDVGFRVSLKDKHITGNRLYAWSNLKIRLIKDDSLVNTSKIPESREPVIWSKPKKHTIVNELCENIEANPDIGCIYQFYNIETGMRYIGQSVNPDARLEQHVAQAFKHGGAKFQKALAYYGLINFAFSIIRDCPVSEMNYWECYHIDEYNSFHNGYNSTRGNGRKRIKK